MLSLCVFLIAALAHAQGQDVDECALGTHACHVEANCTNTIGGYTCKCKDWFVGDGFDCRGYCNDSCPGRCYEGLNGYTCFCLSFTGCPDGPPVIHSTKVLWRTCNSLFIAWEASNAIWAYPRISGTVYYYHSYGTKVAGILYLQPDTEYNITLTVSNNLVSTTTVIPVRTLPEPSYPTTTPPTSPPCTNTPTSCCPGYVRSGSTCIDLDECTNNSSSCNANAHCNNTEGNFTCTCNDCYVGDGFTCIRHCGGDGCWNGRDCSTYYGFSTATYSIPPTILNLRLVWRSSTGLSFAWNRTRVTFSNAFLTGGDVSYVQHIDGEAGFSFLKPSTTYNLTVVVHNQIGSAKASIIVQTEPDESPNVLPTTSTNTSIGCGPGFRLENSLCVDIDECTQNLHNCHPEAVCTNTEGSYKCSCNLGFFGDGTMCVGMCQPTAYSYCGYQGICESTEYGGLCHCYDRNECPGDPGITIRIVDQGSDFVSISWSKNVQAYLNFIYDVSLWRNGTLVTSYRQLRNKRAAFGNLQPNTHYVITVAGRGTNATHNISVYTGVTTTSPTMSTTTSPTMSTTTSPTMSTTTFQPSTTATTQTSQPTNPHTTQRPPKDCNDNPTAREYRETYKEWKTEYQKWKSCYQNVP